MPLPPDSPQALYHSVPQLPEASNSEIALDAEAEDLDPPQDIPPELIDHKIKWINFVLGCAVLLPWNGAPSMSILLRSVMLMHTLACSHYHGNAIFPLAFARIVIEVDLRVLFDDHVHALELHIPRPCHNHLQTRQLPLSHALGKR